jgi:hypothetical protein
MVQRQLQRLEAAGILVSQLKDRTRLFVWNPRFMFPDQLGALLQNALQSLSESERRRCFTRRSPCHPILSAHDPA